MRSLTFALLILIAIPCTAQHWEQIAGDLGESNTWKQHWLDTQNDRLVMSTSWGIRILDLSSEDWTIREDSHQSFNDRCVVGHPDHINRLLVGVATPYWDGEIYLSDDLWETYELVYSPGYDGEVFDIKMDPTDHDRYFAACNFHGVHRSQDGGFQWESVSYPGHYVYSVGIGPNGVIYACGPETLIRSTDHGATWVSIDPAISDEGWYPMIEADPTLPGHVLVANGMSGDPIPEDDGLYETFDGGVSWEKILDREIWSIAIHPNNPELIAVRRLRDDDIWQHGVTFDGGTTWIDWQGNLTDWDVYSMFFSPSDQRLYGYDVYDFWTCDLFPTSTTEVPYTSSLSASPNPFNPSTTITYELAVNSQVRLAVYNLAGRIVRTLVDDPSASAGRYKAIWDGCDESGKLMSSGVYFCHLEAGSDTESRSLVLLK